MPPYPLRPPQPTRPQHTSACSHENCGSKHTSRAALRSTGPGSSLIRPSRSEQPRAELAAGGWNVPCAKRYAARWNTWNASIVDHERLWKIGWSAASRRAKKSVCTLPAYGNQRRGEADGGEGATQCGLTDGGACSSASAGGGGQQCERGARLRGQDVSIRSNTILPTHGGSRVAGVAA